MKKFLSFILLITLSLNLIWTLPAANAADNIDYSVEHYVWDLSEIEWDFSNHTKVEERDYSVASDNFASLFPATIVAKLTAQNIDLNNVKNWDRATLMKYFNTMIAMQNDPAMEVAMQEFYELHKDKILSSWNYKIVNPWEVDQNTNILLSNDEADLGKQLIVMSNVSPNFTLPLSFDKLTSALFAGFVTPKNLAKVYYDKLYITRINDFENNTDNQTRNYIVTSFMVPKNHNLPLSADWVCQWYKHVGYYDSTNINDADLVTTVKSSTSKVERQAVKEIIKKLDELKILTYSITQEKIKILLLTINMV